jgi:hypothetical protein
VPLLRRYGWLVAIAAAYLYVFPYYPKLQSANELPRVYLVKAIVDDHTFAIDQGVATWGETADLSRYGGHFYQNKAPGASLVAVPVYAAVSWIAGPPSLATTMWLCRIVTSVIPSLLLLWLLWGYLAKFAPEPATRRLVLVAYAFGSMAFTYSVLYYAHQLSAVCIASAWILAEGVADRTRGVRTMAAVGVLAGLAPVVDYQTAFAIVPLAVYLAWRLRAWNRRELARAFGLAAIAGAVPLVLLLYYHHACFGSAWKTGYNYAVTFGADHTHGLLGMTYPKLRAIAGTTIAPDNGFFVLAPWWLLAIPGGVISWRTGGRAVVVLIAALAAIFFYFVTSLTAWRAGWEVGPRYIVALQPFLLPLIATAFAAWRERPRLLVPACGLVLIGVVNYTASTVTLPSWPANGDSVGAFVNPLYQIAFRLLTNNAVAPNLASALGLHGVIGIVPMVVGILALVGYSIIEAGAGRRGLVLAALIAAVGISAFALVHTDAQAARAAEAGYARTLYPAVAQ